jgi:hypothetical protein
MSWYPVGRWPSEGPAGKGHALLYEIFVVAALAAVMIAVAWALFRNSSDK